MVVRSTVLLPDEAHDEPLRPLHVHAPGAEAHHPCTGGIPTRSTSSEFGLRGPPLEHNAVEGDGGRLGTARDQLDHVVPLVRRSRVIADRRADRERDALPPALLRNSGDPHRVVEVGDGFPVV